MPRNRHRMTIPRTPVRPGCARSWRALALVVVIVALEAGALLWQLRTSGPMGGDANEYNALAHNLADRHCYSVLPDCEPATFRTPGYPLFLAAIYQAGGGNRAVRLVQFVLHALTAYLLYETAILYFSESVALVAALLYATFLPLAVSPLYLMPETVATAATVATVWAGSKLPGWRWAILFGVLGGSAYVVRPTLVLLPVGIGLGLLATRRAPFRQLLAAGLACIAVLAPMVARNSAVEHRFTLVGSPPGWPVYVSALQWEGRVTYRLTAEPFLPLTQERERRITTLHRTTGSSVGDATAAVDRQYLRDGLREYARIPLHRFVLGWPVRMFYLWGPDESGLGLPYFFLLVPLQWGVVVALALWGLWRERRRLGAQCALWIPVACLSVFHTVFHVEPRYAFMGWPFLLIYSAGGLCAVAGRVQLPQRRPAAAGGR